MTTPTIIKLGGSVITDKKVAYSYRERTVRAMARAIAASGIPSVIVHGGGSFGHPLAKRYGLSSRRSASFEGVSETRGAMLALNAKVCSSLLIGGVRPYSFAPFTLLDHARGAAFVRKLVDGGMTPVTFGDVVHDGRGFRVLSGDTICVELAQMLGAQRCVMAMNVPGFLDSEGDLVKVMTEEKLSGLESGGDATGGIAFKMREAFRMASSGTEVRLVSGARTEEFLKALKGLAFTGTTVRVAQGVSNG